MRQARHRATKAGHLAGARWIAPCSKHKAHGMPYHAPYCNTHKAPTIGPF